jgi:hypothetical protein|tara:strand:+ start:522 stop:1007 length:486 start_codon:yes stop_codon:yes gene_type:complete
MPYIKRGPIVALFFLIFLYGCAGNAPKPIAVVQSGDYQLNCDQLTSSVNSIASFGNQLSNDETDKWKRNIGLASAGAFLIVPYFFMDLTEGDNVEINAARARYIHLHRIAVSKKCPGFDENEPVYDLQTNLRKLDILYESGTLTKEEYLKKRAQLIEESEL